MPALAERIATNLAEVRVAIASACRQHGRDPQDIRLIAVTKEQTPEVLAPLSAAGVSDLGENRLEHLELMHASAPAATCFHFLGRVQSRQLAKLVPYGVCMHSLCEADHIERLGRACVALQRRLQVFIQVNVADDPAKAGVHASNLGSRLELARRTPGLEVVGLMTMAPLSATGEQADEGTVRRCFATLRALAEQHGLARLSMGMSEDFLHAVAEGATDLRIGTRLFR